MKKKINIYTSYFANNRNFAPNTMVLSITRFPPSWSTYINLSNLAPSDVLLRQYHNRDIDETIFSYKYIQELKDRGLTPEKVRAGLELISNGKDIILCCYEKPGDFCHRHVLANWLKDVTEL